MKGKEQKENTNTRKSSNASTSEEKNDIWRRIADSIPDNQLKPFLWLFSIVIVLALAFNFYSSFWGSPRMRAQLKEKRNEIEYLKRELALRDSFIEMREFPFDVTVPSKGRLDTFDSLTPDSIIFEAYSEDVDPIFLDPSIIE